MNEHIHTGRLKYSYLSCRVQHIDSTWSLPCQCMYQQDRGIGALLGRSIQVGWSACTCVWLNMITLALHGSVVSFCKLARLTIWSDWTSCGPCDRPRLCRSHHSQAAASWTLPGRTGQGRRRDSDRGRCFLMDNNSRQHNSPHREVASPALATRMCQRDTSHALQPSNNTRVRKGIPWI